MWLARYLYYPAAVALACAIVAEAREAAAYMQAASDVQSLAGATELTWKSWLETLSLSLYTGATDVRAAYGGLVAEAARRAEAATTSALALVALSIAQLAVLRPWRRDARRTLAWHVILIGLIAFGVGVLAPMLTVVAHADVPVLGRVVLKHETKSIMSTIGQLFGNGNLALALLLSAFSIVVPLLKCVLMLLALVPGRQRLRAASLAVLHAVGRWSMTDVFVVAVLVAYLAFDKDAVSRASIGLGLYFFAGYCLLSLAAAQLLATGASPPGERAQPGHE